MVVVMVVIVSFAGVAAAVPPRRRLGPRPRLGPRRLGPRGLGPLLSLPPVRLLRVVASPPSVVAIRGVAVVGLPIIRPVVVSVLVHVPYELVAQLPRPSPLSLIVVTPLVRGPCLLLAVGGIGVLGPAIAILMDVDPPLLIAEAVATAVAFLVMVAIPLLPLIAVIPVLEDP